MAAELMGAGSSAVSRGFVGRLPEVISALSPFVSDVPREGRAWVFYGSMPLGSSGAGSDVDVLLLHDGAAGPAPHRRSASWGSVPVTVYVLSHADLMDDGSQRRFGGYFALKLFSPFVSNRPEVEPGLAVTTARFLGSYSRAMVEAEQPARRSWCADQLVAHAYLAFLNLYPDFVGYLARLLSDRAQFSRVWQHQRRVYVEALRRAGYVVEAEGGRWRYAAREPVSDVARVRAHCTARFWAFGAVCHDSDPGFPDLYFRKADAHASGAEQAAAVTFVREVAEGKKLA